MKLLIKKVTVTWQVTVTFSLLIYRKEIIKKCPTKQIGSN